eukprot:CAMPEP_0170282788 /NCGR_PEP_ID=MMETSP0116_2-20130129/41422_1 /TAXON_ID=400756 /ORGANISM="Durinskia baltica, Strain CSIRO CS-38" /LENGTH=252 /DNA_ID=CAMNT_0010534147 /DNA_START=46 /DNA_END=801 /DNA_ORIENTATION=-
MTNDLSWVEGSFVKPPDYRAAKCKSMKFPDKASFPKVTIIIPYLMEAWFQIKATVGSLLWATDMDLVDEVRFIDDANPLDHRFRAKLQALHQKIRVITNPHRIGLTQSKVVGAQGAKGDILIFLEPHCVMTPYWLEAMLSRMMQVPKTTVVIPVIDIIQEYKEGRTAQQLYQKAGIAVGNFKIESLEFGWMSLLQRNSSYSDPEPYPAPAMPGGIFGIWRSWWEESGTYDEEMGEWGGENIEMSLRLWRCGG